MQARTLQYEKAAQEALRNQIPVRGLPGVRIRAVKAQPTEEFDVQFELESRKRRVLVLGEIKSAVSPKLLEGIAPWIRRLKSLREDVSFAPICLALCPHKHSASRMESISWTSRAMSQSTCLAPSPSNDSACKARNGVRPRIPFPAPTCFPDGLPRVLRVLLEESRTWTLTGIANELKAESKRFGLAFSTKQVDFAIHLGTISKALASLDEQLWIRRQGSSILVP